MIFPSALTSTAETACGARNRPCAVVAGTRDSRARGAISTCRTTTSCGNPGGAAFSKTALLPNVLNANAKITMMRMMFGRLLPSDDAVQRVGGLVDQGLRVVRIGMEVLE